MFVVCVCVLCLFFSLAVVDRQRGHDKHLLRCVLDFTQVGGVRYILHHSGRLQHYNPSLGHRLGCTFCVEAQTIIPKRISFFLRPRSRGIVDAQGMRARHLCVTADFVMCFHNEPKRCLNNKDIVFGL